MRTLFICRGRCLCLLFACVLLAGAVSGCSWAGRTAGKTQAKVERKVDALESGYKEGYNAEKNKSAPSSSE